MDPVLVQGEKESDVTVLTSPLTLFLVFETVSLSPDRPGTCVAEGGLPLCSTRVAGVHYHASLCLWLRDDLPTNALDLKASDFPENWEKRKQPY